ncbi:MAG: U32 family peptidase [Clostridia bacterium]|nr:U32 family peptidase [Clostridia bacterium]
MENIEILSPAGSMESLIAAVRSGADAVYVGAVEFSARRNAENFDSKALISAVEYCHIRGVKLYLTINIMIKNSETKSALSLAGYANSIGVDGLIVSDIGLSHLIHLRYPDIPLHASTQMTIHNPSALPLLKKLGFSRVVIAREMSKEEIKEFCKAAKEEGIEVEMFVHGALCMCVSGLCLMSSVLGSRSGNRGLCAGPCRLPFSVEGGTGYDLSLKDLSLLDEIGELSALGVKSFKIEGRMKRPEYVSASTKAARDKADNIETADNTLSAVFSRSGFTKGYYENKLGLSMFGIRTRDDVLSSNAVLSSIHEYYRNERQSVPLCINVKAYAGDTVEVTFFDGVNISVIKGEKIEKAKNKPTTKEAIINALSKLGGTPYFAKSVEVKTGDDIFVPLSVLNETRRKAVEELNQKRSLPPKRRETDNPLEIKDKAHKTAEIIALFNKENSIPEDLSGIDGIILPPDADFSALPKDIKKIVALPRYFTNSSSVKQKLQTLKRDGVTAALCDTFSAISIAKETGLSVISSFGMNTANDVSCLVLESLGVQSIVTSMEMTLKEINNLKTPLNKGIFAYGRIPLMLTKNCPVKNGKTCKECAKGGKLTDRKGIEFPVVCNNLYSEIVNSAPTYLADRLEEIKGVDFLLLYFTTETKEQVSRIIKEYKAGGTPPEKYTRGLYFKGVK